MIKLVVVINGNGGVGKDTLCDFVGKYYRVKNISAIEPIKKIARENGWRGEKDANSRKFLAELKQVFVNYNDLPYKYLCQEYEKFQRTREQILFVHIREGDEIQKFKKCVQLPCVAILITRKQVSDISWGNKSDDNVNNYTYDYTYDNNKSLEDAERDFVDLITRIYKKYGIDVSGRKCKLINYCIKKIKGRDDEKGSSLLRKQV